MQPYLDRVRRFAREEHLFRRLNRVLVAVSGGPDSVAALLALQELGRESGFEVVAGHFDHRLRPESRADLEYVRELCGALGVPCFTGEGDVSRVARETRRGVEETARRMRYQFLAFLAGKETAGAVATGHTADDQVETVLQRIMRGSGVRGIRGMLPRARVPGAEPQDLIRPLLVLRRSETLDLCRSAGVVPREDLSNRDLRYSRNRIRLDLLPSLRKENPAIDDALLGLAESARELFEPVERQAMAVQPAARDIDGSVFPLAEVVTLGGEALLLLVEREAAFWRLNVEVNRTRLQNVRRALECGDGRAAFGGIEVEVSSGLVRIGPPARHPADFAAAVLNVPGLTRAGPFRARVYTEPAGETVRGARVVVIDPSRARGALRLRPIRAGDRLRRPDREVRVADLLGNAKVPRWQRRRMLAVADGTAVLGLVGLPADLSPRVDPDSALWVEVVEAGPPA